MIGRFRNSNLFFEETGGVCTPTEIYYQIKKSSGYSTGKLRDKEGNEKKKTSESKKVTMDSVSINQR